MKCLLKLAVAVALLTPPQPQPGTALSVGWDGPGRGSATISYYIGQAPAHMGQPDFEAAVESGLAEWAAVVNLTFVRTWQPGLPRSIDFTFGSIDGPDNTLAQTYYPNDINPEPVAGDVLFDAAEQWEPGDSRGGSAFELRYVAAHEIAHALGVGHSDAPGAVMGRTLSPGQSYRGLTPDDRRAIRDIYRSR